MDFAEAQQLRWEQLHLLKQIYEEGHISKIEYESRKRQIIDELTDTTAYPTSNNNNDVMLSSSRIEHDDEDESEEKVLLSPNSPGLRLRPPSFAHHHDSFGSSISSSSISTTASSTNSNLSVASAPARAPLSPSAYYEGSSMIPGSYYREGELPIPVLRKHRMSLNQPPSNLNSGGAVAGAGGRPHKHRRPCRKDVVPEDLSFPIVAHEPPKFEHIQHEKAIRYTIMLDQKKWQKSKCKVKIDEIPFARGGLRIVYHLWDEEQKSNMVAKVSMNAKEKSDKRAYATDIHVQALAKQYADGFNSYDPPKKVDFLIPYLLELVERPGHPICAVEPYISGPYIKYNNNDGFVVSQEIDRNTPQAFSHYTYEASSHSLLICDIQGVNDIYTDPQVHTAGSKRMGRGDMGRAGMEKFLESHRCNAVCKYLKLPSIRPEYEIGATKPVNDEMEQEQIHREPVENLQPVEETSLLAAEEVIRADSSSRSIFFCCSIL